MNTKRLVLAGLVILLAGCIYYVPYDQRGAPRAQSRTYSQDYEGLDSGYFYDYLDPYGAWIRYSPYGYVWIPRDVGYRWRPYTYGHWIWTDYGWHWASAERYGWLVYHYGRWGWDIGIGWYWVPDTLWGPSWVIWRSGDFYVGWTPIPPGIDLRPGRGYGRWNNLKIPESHWIFVRGSNFLDRSLDRWILPHERNVRMVNMTSLRGDIRFRGNRAVNEGLDVESVRRMTRTTVEKYELKDAKNVEERRVQGREAVVYRPEVSSNESAAPKDYLEGPEVKERIERGEIGEVVRRAEIPDKTELTERHKRESTLLKESQEEEISLIRRRAEESRAKASDPEEKKKIQSRVVRRIAEVQKAHEQEQEKLVKRQKEEEEKAEKSRVKKKVIRK